MYKLRKNTKAIQLNRTFEIEEDIKYLKQQVLKASKIPKSYFDIDENKVLTSYVRQVTI